ncbi:4-alpha-glucanotransferase [Coraliomargarita akajimensis]|uniref:4-alpha-glucanotransferase n=1 Tax=Coraliomargarita akajimensis (strain DSM 45221 / IAM 15411 / JCM 23193 / KCTC 12865 / 04OKA010-24) TaxID=583355 RepID=D5EPI0_CORAD|nr:4-alpha-glucanotransferase [Coraliomargarita akajimensis]ADE53717.1 4-alpha-glucanotransferase [Coraliomargarita akajimensis DSM 45221]
MKTQYPLYNWLQDRSAGVLLHISSLPSSTGIGNFGTGAYRFVDFMQSSGFRVWQICPLGPTGFGDSPYQCFSAFAGNPYFIDLEPLIHEGLLHEDEIGALRALPHTETYYGELYEAFWPLMRLAHERFARSGADHVQDYGSLPSFRKEQAFWIEDFAHFMAFKEHFEGRCWLDWPASFRDHSKAMAKALPADLQAAVDAQVFYQYLFFAQLSKLRHYAQSKGVELMGDVPIFVALDSADVWSHRNLFQLKADGQPSAVAGVPPDLFSEDGQRWGNPLYAWEVHQADKFSWWLERIRSNLSFFDLVRLDHFRGFESYWSVPEQEVTARHGEWIQSPGLELFTAVKKTFPDAKFIAEDLGVVTEEVEQLCDQTGLPRMAILQFAFGDGSGNPFLPHNVGENYVVYSGTHDNETTVGWYANADSNTQDHVRRYLSVSSDEIAWDFTRAAIRSNAKLAVIPLQDLMSLGNEARFNEPGNPVGNWQWRYGQAELDRLQAESSGYLRDQLELFGRA